MDRIVNGVALLAAIALIKLTSSTNSASGISVELASTYPVLRCKPPITGNTCVVGNFICAQGKHFHKSHRKAFRQCKDLNCDY
jgi:hypothetical protein